VTAVVESPGSASPGGSIVGPVLELEDVHARIGVSHILQGVSLTVPHNAVTAVLGRNGVGKTSTLRSILGLMNRTGSITLNGERIEKELTHSIIKRGVAYVPEDRDVFHGLTVAENLRLAERKGSPQNYDRVYELFPELKARAKQVAGTLSGGQQQMVSLGRGLLNDNILMLIDEPTKGLAPKLVTEVVEVLERIRGTSSIVMVEQNLAAANRLADHVVVLAEGRVVLQGPAAELLGDEQRIRELLGVADARRRE
jgi:branched-chain amino acid transport system ATP-binding protein